MRTKPLPCFSASLVPTREPAIWQQAIIKPTCHSKCPLYPNHSKAERLQATLTAVDSGQVPDGYIRDVVERVTPSILRGKREGMSRVDEFEAYHVSETGAQLTARSTAISEKVGRGELAIVGLTYQLADGRVVLRGAIGDVEP